MHERVRERRAVPEQRNPRISGRAAIARSSAFAREADEADRSAGAGNGRFHPQPNDRRRQRSLREDRNERTSRAVFGERERRARGIVPNDQAVLIGALVDQTHADEERHVHVRKRAAAAQIHAPHDQAVRAFFRHEPDVRAIEPNLLHGVAAARFDDVKALLRPERHGHVARSEAISRRRREMPAHKRPQPGRVDRSRHPVLPRDDDLGRIEIVCRKIDGRARVRIEPHGRRFPRHVHVAREQGEIRIPLVLVQKRPRRQRRHARDEHREHEQARRVEQLASRHKRTSMCGRHASHPAR